MTACGGHLDFCATQRSAKKYEIKQVGDVWDVLQYAPDGSLQTIYGGFVRNPTGALWLNPPCDCAEERRIHDRWQRYEETQAKASELQRIEEKREARLRREKEEADRRSARALARWNKKLECRRVRRKIPKATEAHKDGCGFVDCRRSDGMCAHGGTSFFVETSRAANMERMVMKFVEAWNPDAELAYA